LGQNEEKMNLILLIGTNPLPNFVVARYFKDKIKRLILIYSEENNTQRGTLEYAEIIKELIQIQECHFISLINVGSAQQIRRDLKEKLIINSNELMHLNYTGGTKTMAVQVYNFIIENYSNVKLSYLDSRTFRIIYDDGTYEPQSGDLRDNVVLDINTVLKLHLYEKIEKNENNPFPKVLDKLKWLVKNEKIRDFILWINQIRLFYKNGGKFLEKKGKYMERKNDSCFQNVIRKFEQIPDEILEVLNTFDENKRLNDNGKKIMWVPGENISNKEFKERIKNTFEFLDGKWFENYIYDELKSSINDLREKINFGWSLEARKKNYSMKFELDIFLIRGYQLIGISITTDDKMGLCKHKGFEVFHRVRQIGGDEGIAILITALSNDKAENLKKDLYHITGSSDEKILVFGIDDWKDIGVKIKQEVYL